MSDKPQYQQHYERIDTVINAETVNYHGQAVPEDTAKMLHAAYARLEQLPLDRVPAPAPLPVPNRMQHRHNPQFVGRDDDLQAIAALIKAQRTTAIVAATGIGGVGKTQLASEFAHRYGQFFLGGVFWVDASSAAAIRADIAACGDTGALNLPGFAALSSVDAKVQRVRSEWHSEMPRLLVFDNLEDPQLLAFAPTTGGCRVLLTARRMNWSKHSGVTTHALQTLDRPDSLRLLFDLRADQTPPTDNPDADATCDALGDLPLALTLAGAYLTNAPSVKLRFYLDAITAEQVQHASLNVELEEELPTDHAPSIVETFRLSYDQLDDSKPTDALAHTLLHRAARCAPAPIPRRLLVRAAGFNPMSRIPPPTLRCVAWHRWACSPCSPRPTPTHRRRYACIVCWVRMPAPAQPTLLRMN